MLTLLIPTKNHGIYLEHLLANVVFGPGSPVTNLLIFNDGSTDNTAEILSKYANDKRVRIMGGTSSIGVMLAYQQMYPLIETPYMTTIATDDLFYPEAMARLLEATVRNDACMGFGKYQILEDGNLSDLQHPGWHGRNFKRSCDFEALMSYDHYVFLGIYKTDALPQYGLTRFPYDLSLNRLAAADGLGEFRAQDWSLALDMAIAHPDRICFVDEYCGVFRKVANQLSSDAIYVHTGRAVYEMALLILRHLSNYELRQRIKSEPHFHVSVKNLFYAKFGAVTEEAKNSHNFQQIYKPIILAADTILNNM
ncbi:glycosyltransferase family 2 protein [Herbaspirillum rubrisubalbicans]|uniref:Glycosyltransferase family 2 protein n=1 Tax=Herbaspirillum rubrisubalbicans Os34 TaxID=1235827 RepID=A0A6M3ZQP5_9BURK|nr:glycosyltransferase family 2 protein [Herbaspirillum rubrisubalbicans]QJQ00937.1 glycosyltransferase family 2 protein [Herbaspirillum rubrisubalbicans Os34]